VAKSLSANVQFCYLRIWQKDILNQDNQNTICSDPANGIFSQSYEQMFLQKKMERFLMVHTAL